MREREKNDKFQTASASRGFHVYRELWESKLGQTLQVRQEIGNLKDHFVISLGAKISGKLRDFEVVRHISQEITRFCHYLWS